MPLQSLEKSDNFTDVFRQLQQKLPDQAVSMTIELLNQLGLTAFAHALHPHLKSRFAIQDHYDTHFILTLSILLGNMSKDGYKKFMDLACLKYFPNIDPHHLSDKADLVKQLWAIVAKAVKSTCRITLSGLNSLNVIGSWKF